VEGKIDMAARRQVTNKLQVQYRRASKADKSKILDRVVSTTGMGRSTARRALTGPRLPDPGEQVDRRTLRPRSFSDDARALLEHVWALMGMPCGKYLVVMLELWLPLLGAAGDLDKPFATEAALVELTAMSAATVDRYLKPARDRMRIKGISTTKPSPLLRNSITIRTCADEAPEAPGVIEADTVAHCGPTLIARVRPHPDDDRCRDRLDREHLDPQQRIEVDHRGRRKAPAAVPVPDGGFRLGLRWRVHQS
jgi:hypothetical protein